MKNLFGNNVCASYRQHLKPFTYIDNSYVVALFKTLNLDDKNKVATVLFGTSLIKGVVLKQFTF